MDDDFWSEEKQAAMWQLEHQYGNLHPHKIKLLRTKAYETLGGIYNHVRNDKFARDSPSLSDPFALIKISAVESYELVHPEIDFALRFAQLKIVELFGTTYEAFKRLPSYEANRMIEAARLHASIREKAEKAVADKSEEALKTPKK